jgi:hypothetical protein
MGGKLATTSTIWECHAKHYAESSQQLNPLNLNLSLRCLRWRSNYMMLKWMRWVRWCRIHWPEAYGFEYYYLVWTRLLGWTKLKCQIHWPEAVSIDLYIYNLHKPHKLCIILTSTSTSSLCWLGRQSVFCRYPPFCVIGHLQRSECDLRLGTFLPLIHQCEFSTSFLSLKIKLEFCYKHY